MSVETEGKKEMARMMNDYHADFPAIPVAKVRRYARELNRLEEQYGRGLRAKEIVEAARPRKSPLHDYFEWNKEKAAEKYLLQQARALVSVIRVTVVDNDGRRTPARAMVSVITKEKGRMLHVFERHDKVLDDPGFRSQRVDMALNELEAWCKRWEIHRELEPLRKTIIGLVNQERRRILEPKKLRGEIDGIRRQLELAGVKV